MCIWLLQDCWSENFFKKPQNRVIDDYKRRMDSSLGLGAVNTDHIKNLWNLGYLPIEIKALPEGSLVDIKCPLFTIRNTHPDFYWITNYLETQISAEIWKIITSATTAWQYRKLLHQYARMTGAPLDFIPWQGHDFSYRGMSGIHDATSSGAGHLLSFTGTDTISAIDYIEEFYGIEYTEEFSTCDRMIGGSVPATEHSVMCMGGELNEIDTFRRLITEVYPTGTVSIVSDTWDFWKVITEYARILKPEIMARDGKTVFRPDSGDPVKIICGDSIRLRDSAGKGAVECLHEIFPGPKTSKGYDTLDPHVGLIYGDSITLERAKQIYPVFMINILHLAILFLELAHIHINTSRVIVSKAP
jgi:nicotinamide phosphoribosyltransferase